MNKNIFQTILLAVVGLFIAPVAFAANIVFTPSTVNVTTGDNFTVQVSVNPQVKVGAVEVELKYPTDLLEVTGFVLGSNWMAAGDSSIDNTNGVAVKSGGYPGGITSQTVFGTVSFKAKKAGSATVSLGSNSMALNASSANVLTYEATVQATIKDATKPVTQTPPQTQQQTTPSTTTQKKTTPSTSGQTVSQTPVSEIPTSESQAPEASIATNIPAATGQANLASILTSILTLNTNNFFVGLLVIVVIVGAIIWAVDYFKKGKKGDKGGSSNNNSTGF
jgi:hypothetical protein